jgi:TonB-linked SusC/RagA family outer membrane protein
MKKKLKEAHFFGNGSNLILRKMKLTVFFSFLLFLSSYGTGLSQTTLLSLNLKNVPVQDLIRQVEDLTDFKFIYQEDVFRQDQKITIQTDQAPIDTVLQQLAEQASVGYRIFDNQIVILKYKTEELPSVIKSETKAEQKKELSGTVKDNKGLSLPGASVFVKGTTIGTIADIDGQFRFSVPVDAKVIVFSFVGMKSQEITLVNQTNLNIVLEEATAGVDEVVVVGYGVQKKESVVGAISTAKGSDLVKAGGVTNISSALTGLVPGLVTINSLGKPGQDQADILIRGKSTWNDAAPLILVDGMEEDMNNIDVNDVDNISVLKDASATAVFGVRGANGVILITTKRGKVGKTVFKFGACSTLKMISKMPTYANSYESRWMRNEAIEIQTPSNEFSWADYTPYEILMHFKNQDMPYLFPDVNWQKETVRDLTWSQKYNLEISGGTDFVKYFAAISYLYDGDIIKIQDFGQGYLPENNFKRLNFRTNLDFQLTKTTTFSVDIEGSQGKVNSFSASSGNAWGGPYGKAPDLYPIRYEDGTFGWSSGLDSKEMNPVYAFNFHGMNATTTSDINTTFRVDQKLDNITKGLSFKAIGSFQGVYATSGPNESGNATELKYIDPYTGQVEITFPKEYTDLTNGFNYEPIISTTTAEKTSAAGSRNLMYQASLNYNRNFGKHTIGGLINFKRQQRTSGNDFTYYREEWAGRLTYDYENRYLLETNIGYNGSEQFGPGYKFGFFPSYALGWNLGNEEFFKKNVRFMNKMKFRFSTGTVGNDNAGNARWLYVSSWSYGKYSQFGNVNPSNSPYIMVSETNIGNPNIRWETAVKNDFAIETAFFKNMITLNFDYFWGHRKDIFMSASQRNIAPWFGANPVAANIGETKDHGLEIEIGFNKTTDFGLRFYANLSLSYVKDKIIFMEDPELTPDYMKNAGFPIDQVRVTPYSGLIKSWDEMYTGVMNQVNNTSMVGDYRFIDYNADGFIDNKDVVPYGYADHPQIANNYTIGADYKGLSLMVQFYSTRNSTLDESLTMWGQYLNQSIDRIVLDNAWIPGRENTATYHRPNWNISGGGGNGQYSEVDGTLWRLKTAEIAYTFTGGTLKKMGINNTRLYVNGNDLFLWSHLNEDRESGGIRGTSALKYPMTKRINFGIDISF